MVFVIVAGSLCTVNSAFSFMDPTRPSSHVDRAGPQKYQLESTLVSASRAVAVINGRVVTVGDFVGNNKIMSISKNKVTLTNGQHLVDLTLSDPKINKVKSNAE